MFCRGSWFLAKFPEKHLASDGLTEGSQICGLDERNTTAGYYTLTILGEYIQYGL